MSKKTIELEELLKHASKHDLKQYIEQSTPVTFSDFFDSLINKYKISKSMCITKSNLDRTYAYQIIQGKKQGSKDKIIQLALGLSCNVEECNKLLILSNNSILYAKHKRDAIIIYALEKKLNTFQTNELLMEFNGETLK